jgi:Spy/CpxP family protein refolding chaperone
VTARSVFGALFLAALVCGPSSAFAAQQGGRAGAEVGGQQQPGISPAEVQQMFDSVELYQAQQQLKVSDDQFPQFLRRFKNLQDIRRMGQNGRARLVNQLAQLINAPAMDEAAVTGKLKELRDLDARVAADVAKAYDAIDEVLTVQQRARFRVFEARMEQQKLELVTRARNANRPKP